MSWIAKAYRWRNYIYKNHPKLAGAAHLFCYGKIDIEDMERAEGAYFDIPKCCVEFFISMGRKGFYRMRALEATRLFGEATRGYVRCPMCRFKERLEQRRRK
jgi:hypothetical protein